MLPTQTIGCPYCGEPIEILLDDSVAHQRYIEDCQVCCRPIDIEVSIDESGDAAVTARSENEI